MAQFQLTFTIGLGEDRDGNTIPDGECKCIRVAVLDYVSREFPGGTITDGQGFWRANAEDGQSSTDRPALSNNMTRLITEPVIVLTTDVWGMGTDQARHHAQALANIALQTAVHVSVREIYAVDVLFNGQVDDWSDLSLDEKADRQCDEDYWTEHQKEFDSA